ncbi:MAG: hypothetical protein R3301_09165 [Saprospiraceae bacterium]|nr:hypothetical protein [Saprospiraceae bacterium]
MGSGRIALATCAIIPDLIPSERQLIPLLASRGITAIPVVWSDNSVDWKMFDLIVIRSIWDYHLRYPAFLRWLDLLEHSGIRVLNPVPTLRTNSHKSYLDDLRHGGVTVIRTVYFSSDERPDLARMMAANQWRQAVIKPCVAASAHLTFVLPEHIAEAQAALASGMYHNGGMLQPFVDQVQDPGEWSLVFFNGTYSHAVLKTAASGEFRVQHEYGGHVRASDPPASIIDQAADVMAALPAPLLYARIDGVEHDGLLILMEAELIEPDLFLLTQSLREVFADAIAAHLSGQS